MARGWLLLLDMALMQTVVAKVDEECCRAGCFPAIVKDDGMKAGLSEVNIREGKKQGLYGCGLISSSCCLAR